MSQLNAEAYQEPSQAPKMELFAKIVNDFHSLTIFAKSYISDIWLGSECASEGIFEPQQIFPDNN